MNVHAKIVPGSAGRMHTNYSWDNVPPSVKEAAVRLDEDEFAIISIENQLKDRMPEDFESHEAYDSWRKRANAALTHIQKEFRFINRWLKDSEARSRLINAAIQQEKERERREQGIAQRLRDGPSGEDVLNSAQAPMSESKSTTEQDTDILGMLLDIAKGAYRAGTLSPAHKDFFEKTFVIRV